VSSASLSRQQIAKLRAKIREVHAHEGRFLKYLAARWRDEGIKRLGNIPARSFDEAMAVLEAKRRDPRKPWTLDEMLTDLQGDTSEQAAVIRRALERVKMGDDPHKAWRAALAEQLAKWPRSSERPEFLKQLAADLIVEEHEPQLKRERDRENLIEIDSWLTDLFAKRYSRTQARQVTAKILGVKVSTLNQRRYRPAGSRRRRRPKGPSKV